MQEDLNDEDIRAADQSYRQSLLYDDLDQQYAVNYDEPRDRSSTFHPRKSQKDTPKISYSQLNLMPDISVREWLHHTSQMLIFDWFPLTYFTMASILAPKDYIGCKTYGQISVQNLLFWVYGPILLMRFLGTLFMNKRNLIIYQLIIIYGYLIITLTIWDVHTITGLKSLDRQCFKPLHMSMLNIILMLLFYMFVLCPYYTIVILLPYYFYQIYKYANVQRQRILMKHYLIKAMPSVIFDKKLFERENLECAICMEPFEEKHDYVTPLSCDARHYFHSDCIEEWLNKKNECPLCKCTQTPKSMRRFSENFQKKLDDQTPTPY